MFEGEEFEQNSELEAEQSVSVVSARAVDDIGLPCEICQKTCPDSKSSTCISVSVDRIVRWRNSSESRTRGCAKTSRRGFLTEIAHGALSCGSSSSSRHSKHHTSDIDSLTLSSGEGVS